MPHLTGRNRGVELERRSAGLPVGAVHQEDPIVGFGSSAPRSASEPQRGGGESLESSIEGVDWSPAGLGPLDVWPPSLKTSVQLMLASSFPAFVFWGPDLALLHNGAGGATLGQEPRSGSPGSPARLCWSPVWDRLGPALARAFEEGQPGRLEELPLVVPRAGSREERYFALALSPIVEDGRVGGVFAVAHDTTAAVVGARQLRALRDLAALTEQDASVEAIGAAAAAVLAANRRDVPFALVYALEPGDRTARMVGAHGVAADQPFSPASIRLDRTDAPWPIASVLDARRAVRVDDLPGRFGQAVGPPDEMVSTALVLPAGSAAVLVAGLSPRRPLDEEQRRFLDLAAAQIGAAADRARALAEQSRHARRLWMLASASAEIGAARTLEETLETISAQSREMIGAHQAATVLRVGPDWSQARNAVSLSDRYGAWRGYDAPRTGAGIYGLVCQLNLPMRLTAAELTAHPAWRGFGAEAERHPPLRGWLAAPLIDRQGENVGLIQLSDRYEGEFDEADEALLVQIAQIASAAIESTRVYQEAQQAIQVRDEFLSFVSHDLRTPLTSIKGFAQLLRRQATRGDAENDQWLHEGLGRIDATTSRMAAMIDELLDVARLQAGRPLELRLRPVDLAHLARQCAVETQQTSSQHQVVVDAPPEGAVGWWDRVRLERVISNLLSNAVKYSPAGGPIEVRIRTVDQGGERWAELAVTDRGVGIPEDDQERIFERFQRAGNVGDRIRGSGLGLAGARQIVEQHGGRILVASQEGQGSTFTVRLPVAPPAGVPT